MGKASISVLINGKWNGGDAVDAAVNGLSKLSSVAGDSAASVGASLARQEENAKRISRMAASTSKSTSQALAQMGNDWVVAGGKIYNVGKSIEETGNNLTTAVTLPLVALGGYAGQAAVKYDTALANVRKTTDLTEKELDSLGKAAIELSTKQPVTAETILNVEALGAQMGVSTDRLQEFASVVTGLDIATDMDVDTAATEMARFANITGMAEDKFRNYGSTIVAIGNNMATTESEVSNMAQRIASAGHQAGMSEAEILGFAGALSSLGMRADAGGSAISTTFVKISKAVSMGGEKLDAFAKAAGMSASEFKTAWQTNAAEAFTTLLQGIHDSSEAGTDMNVTLKDLGITAIRESDAMRRMAGSVDVVTDALDLSRNAWEENVALQNEVDSRNESMASRLQVLANKVEAVAITVGVPLVNAVIDALDAATPLIDTVASLADAFANADEGTQQAVLALAGIAAASGPALTVLGKLTQGVGGVVTSFGNLTRDAAVYQDAMNSVDGAQIRVYGSAKTLATNMGISRNKVVQAAGGVDTYVEAWENWYDSSKLVTKKTEQLNALREKAATATGKQAQAVSKSIDALTGEVEAATKVRDSSKELIDGWKQAAGVTETLSDANTTLYGKLSMVADYATKSAASMALQAVQFGAVTLAATAVAAAVGTVVGWFVQYKEHSDLMSSATQTFSDVAGSAEAAAKSYAEGLEDVETGAKAALQGLADLNREASETMDEYYSGAETVDTYVDTIERLMDSSSLTATQQERLKNAVAGYNEVTGSSIEVIDAATGSLSTNVFELRASTEEWKRNAEAQALQQLAVKYMQEQTEATLALNKAKANLAEANAKFEEAQRNNDIPGMVKYGAALNDAQAEVHDLTEAQQSATASVEQLTLRQAELAADLNGPLKEAYESLPEGMREVGLEMAQNLADGVSEGTVTADEAATFMTETINGTVSQMPAGMQPIGTEAAQLIAQGLASGNGDVSSASAALSEAAKGNIAALGDYFSAAGMEMPQSLASAIALYKGLPVEQTSEMQSAIALILSNGDTAAAANLLGHDIDEGLANGIRDGTLSEEMATALGEDVLEAAKTSLDSHSPSRKFIEVGNDVDEGLKLGIEGSQDGPLTAVTTLGSSIVDALSGLPGKLGLTGSDSSSKLASGLSGGRGSVSSSAGSLSTGASSSVSGLPGTLGGYGSRSASNMASGLSGGWGSVHSAASSLASASEAAGSEASNASTWGSHLASNFASGIRAGLGWVSSAARKIAETAANILHFSVPKDGPWSGAERGGYTSGLHLGQNLAAGMRAAMPEVAAAAGMLGAAQFGSVAASPARSYGAVAPARSVTNNYWITVGGATAKASPRAMELIDDLTRELTGVSRMGGGY